jgi:hypothetical protein
VSENSCAVWKENGEVVIRAGKNELLRSRLLVVVEKEIAEFVVKDKIVRML